MASTSSLLIHKKSFRYDVFLSFRGEDTRKTFVGHLYEALDAKCIETYKDDEKIQKGERISDELIKAIQESRFYIIIFSKNYASSSWCLDELVKIMECQKMTDHTAFPVFYDVEPTQVRNQYGPVGEAFSKHVNKEAAGKWRHAMKELAHLAGWELKATANGDESKSIQIIVDDIFNKKYSTLSNADGKLVGMETRIRDVLSSLEIGTEDVRMIGIKGMGGGGKTTLARAVYDRISNHFEGRSFVDNVREVSNPSLSGLKKLQKRILKDVLHKQDITFSSVHDGKTMLQDMMSRRKTLVVLDDVDCIEQLEALAGEPNWFKSGSRLIITTRDEQVLVAHRVKFVHDVNLLSSTEAICLFSRYAFQTEIPTRGYEELSGQVVQYAHGLPLTIKVLGSFLCDQKEPRWRDAIKRLKTIPLKATMEKLELSYNGLEEDYKEIFLDVACILKGWGKEEAIRVLESRGFHAENGLRVLEQKSLITYEFERLGMHDHLEEMGRNIVRRLHPDEPNKHSRLWITEEIKDILTTESGTQATKCLYFYSPDFNAEIAMKGLANMKGLRFIDVYTSKKCNGNTINWKHDKVSQYLPNSLQFVKWDGFPFSSLPNTFQGKHLVELQLEDSNIVQLWEDGEGKVLNNLRFLTLSSSKLRTFHLGNTPDTICIVDSVHVIFTGTLPKVRLYVKKCYKLGSYVPCEMCVLSPVDIIFTRLGATDRIMTGASTFLIECTETASVLQNASQDSLVILDELGRGTSTFDGYAIAYAVFRHLVEKVNCRLLFATHYHPLTKEFAAHPHVTLQHMACAFKSMSNTSQSTNQQLVFLYCLTNGACPESYGMQVALMAGIPKKVVEAATKAAEVMKTKIGVSFRSSERWSEFSTLHEEWLKSVLAMSRVDDHKLVGGEEDDVFDELFCLWHELKCSNKKLM